MKHVDRSMVRRWLQRENCADHFITRIIVRPRRRAEEVRKAGTNPQGFQLKQADVLFHTYLHSVTTSFVTDYSK